MIGIWLSGLLRRRAGRLAGAGAGVAVAVALLAALGSFLAHSKSTMTERAARGVAVDWQVQLQPGSDPASIGRLVRTSAQVAATARVDFAQTSGMTATTGASTQSTGTGIVLGLPSDYPRLFPGELRLLAGTGNGVLLTQQAAANLHAAPGDVIGIGRAGLAPVHVRVAGVVDLPLADSLFQKVGAPSGARRSAPPDNVLLLPQRLWHRIFDPLATARPDLLSTQFHVLRDHRLPIDPTAAFKAVNAAAHNLEARSAGRLTVGDNLGAALDAARQDAAYAQVLFLFLALPGAVLAGLLTATITAAGAGRRRGEQSLLRSRGASARQVVRLATVEAVLVGVGGTILGLAAASIVGRVAFGTARFGTTTATATAWAGTAAAVGLSIATAAVLIPARRDLRHNTVAAGRASVGTLRYPAWARYGLDVALLIIAVLVFSATSRNGYQLVFAPEGIPTISVSYWAFAGPALVWIGAGLVSWRLVDLLLGRGRGLLTRLLRPLSGTLAASVASMMARQRRALAGAIVLLALALTFAASTAIFNATYRQQAEADAQLTNGADVTVTPTPGNAVQPPYLHRLASVAGVRAVEPIQHRFAYIGNDLQDLYGVRPDTITHATALQNAYFHGGTAAGLMHTLATKPNSILVSAETVRDYQLHPGDPLELRPLDAQTDRPRTVEFRYVGVVSEFPTAPKDSFFVANASYIANKTGSDAIGAFLIDTAGRNTAAIAQRIRRALGASATVTDITTVRDSVGSSLTSVDLAGLTRVELSFAVVLAAASALVFGLGLGERRRSFAIATALGAKPRHLRAMIFSEAAVLAAGGLCGGAIIGSVLSVMLVKVLTGVFDPPPSVIAVPWSYLLAVGALAVIALAGVSATATWIAHRPEIARLREL
jgi:putative ABC transport system permease protein